MITRGFKLWFGYDQSPHVFIIVALRRSRGVAMVRIRPSPQVIPLVPLCLSRGVTMVRTHSPQVISLVALCLSRGVAMVRIRPSPLVISMVPYADQEGISYGSDTTRAPKWFPWWLEAYQEVWLWFEHSPQMILWAVLKGYPCLSYAVQQTLFGPLWYIGLIAGLLK